MGLRKHLSADGLINLVRHSVRKAILKELKSDYSWQDCIMSGLAIFGFKCPSLLQFEKRVNEDKGLRHNLKSLYGVNNLPSNTTLRAGVHRNKASGKVQRFSWVTKIEITQENISQMMRAGRSRWRIDNETFITLKNQANHPTNPKICAKGD